MSGADRDPAWTAEDRALQKAAATDLGLLALLGALDAEAPPSVSAAATDRLRPLADRLGAVGETDGVRWVWGTGS